MMVNDSLRHDIDMHGPKTEYIFELQSAYCPADWNHFHHHYPNRNLVFPFYEDDLLSRSTIIKSIVILKLYVYFFTSINMEGEGVKRYRAKNPYIPVYIDQNLRISCNGTVSQRSLHRYYKYKQIYLVLECVVRIVVP